MLSAEIRWAAKCLRDLAGGRPAVAFAECPDAWVNRR